MSLHAYLAACAAELQKHGHFHFEGMQGARMVFFRITPKPGNMLAGCELDARWEPTDTGADFARFVEAHGWELARVLELVTQ